MPFEWGKKKQRAKQYSLPAALILIAPKWEQCKHPPLEWINPGIPCNTHSNECKRATATTQPRG